MILRSTLNLYYFFSRSVISFCIKDLACFCGLYPFFKDMHLCGGCRPSTSDGETSPQFEISNPSGLLFISRLELNCNPLIFFSRLGDVLMLETETSSSRNSSDKYSFIFGKLIILLMYY
ncbi:unnamed protein product [Moneuplotes crassus]|uniref:Uncharacterized protein n=1 Tax=Euplotes crassus TaxID=5936 RepID=A0AAD1X6C3_EUPCR|nr:unnamed protein product [Moneuplotes crassus]